MNPENRVAVTDPGIDDAAAINYLNKKGEAYTLISSYGNVNGEQAYTNSQRLVRHLKLHDWRVLRGPNSPTEPEYQKYSDMAVYKGNGPDGLWEIPDPDNKLEPELIKRIDPTKVSNIISLAPLTGPLRLIRDGASAEQMLIMGGTLGEGNVLPITPDGEYEEVSPILAEWNMFKDPHAADEFFNIYANEGVHLVPKSTCEQVLLDSQTILEREAHPTTEYIFLSKLVRSWAQKYRKINPDTVKRGLMLADLVAVILYKNPDLADWDKVGVEVVTEVGPELGRIFLDQSRLHCNVALAVTDKEVLYEAICQTVFGE